MHWSFFLPGVMRMSKMLCDYEESITQGTSHYNVLGRVRLVWLVIYWIELDCYLLTTYAWAIEMWNHDITRLVVDGLVAKSCLTLEIPWTIACQVPLSMGFSRQEYWSGFPFPSPGDLPDPGIQPGSPVLQADDWPTELWGRPQPKSAESQKYN